MLLNVPQVVDTLIRTGLVSESIVQQTSRTLAVKRPTFNAHELLHELLSNGHLTPYQVDQIRAGYGNSLVLGNYLLLSELGEGSMGIVYKAFHIRMHRVVALKTLKLEVSSSADFMERFYREVRAAARLNHPNAVAAYDADECEVGHFLVMEFVDGDDLSNIVKKNGPLTVNETVSAIRQAAEAFEYAHRHGIVHRDIKPANLMRDANGVVKVADLGLARLEPTGKDVEEQAELTREGTSMGTVDYMSPEQASNAARADHRADIYSLGCTMHYLLAGQAVYEESSLIGRIVAHREKPIPSLTELRDDVPLELDSLFQKMLAKNVHNRPQSMGDVVSILRGLEKSDEAKIWDPRSIIAYVVEPSEFQGKVLNRFLTEAGIDDLHHFATAQAALDNLPKLRPHVVLSSFQLPDMSGPEFAMRMRADARWSMLPFVLLNGAELPKETVAIVKQSGAMEMIEKPFTRERLEQSLKKVVQESSGELIGFASLDELDVLIVDDSSVARRNIESVLATIGFSRFVHADDGTCGVERMGEQTFDLVVTDYNMPEMNGLELVAFIRQQSGQPEVPVIMVTTEYDPEKLAEVYQLGVSAICNKSFDPELVQNIVQRLFN